MASISDIRICNYALARLKSSKQITSLTERSAEAAACNLFYDTSRQQTLTDFAWPFANKMAALALLEENPNDEWGFSYRYPSDCLMFRRILSGNRNDTKFSRISFKISNDVTGQVVFADLADAEAEYTMDVTDTSLYPADFVSAVSWRLASYIAPTITAGDPFKREQAAMNMYLWEVSRAASNRKNEEQPDNAPESELILAREGGFNQWPFPNDFGV